MQNYNSNLIIQGVPEYIIVEADEYDRSFLQLNPDIAIITSADADHLDIYGTQQNMLDAFRAFATKVKPGGKLILQEDLQNEFPDNKVLSYGKNGSFRATNINTNDGQLYFDLEYANHTIHLHLGNPALYNVSNALPAFAAALATGISSESIANALNSWKGVKRRFEILHTGNTIYIDDYAHHPREIDACISAARQLYPEKNIWAIFQPHLYTRTRDLAPDFSKSLSKADRVLLLDIYPARELPITGVNSKLIGDAIHNIPVSYASLDGVLNHITSSALPDILITMGAGDIDTLPEKISNQLQKMLSTK